MSDNDIEQFLHVFLQESHDRFEILNQELVELEENPRDEERLYSILRHVHSLKGSAGMFGFDNLKQVAHRLEDLMAVVHKSPDLVDRDVMDALFEGCDLLQASFKRIIDNEETSSLTLREKSYLDHLDKVINSFSQGTSLEPLVYELLTAVDELFPSLEGIIDVAGLAECCKKVRSVLDASSGQDQLKADKQVYFAETDLTSQYGTIAALLAKAQNSPLEDDEAKAFFKVFAGFIEVVSKAGIEEIAEVIQDAKDSVEVFADLDLDFDSLQSEYYKDTLKSILAYAQTPKEEVADASGQSRVKRAESAVVKKTVRIEEAKIDHFLENVGEMIILGEVFNNLQKQYAKISGTKYQELLREFKGASADFAKQVFHLQASLMDIRRVEIRNVTASLGRMVRDTANSLGKKINLVVGGESAVIDKSMLDDVNACLVHIVRNSCDHGIELPDERIACGKDSQGVIGIEASNEDDALILKVTDDGKGIDLEKLKAKAVESGKVSVAEISQMSDKQIRDMVFYDGLSTAKQVSDISGRGVGMSSVLEDIRRIGGSIDLKSTPGVGTEVTLRIPLSIMLSVLEGLIIKVGDNGYIVPVRNVVETIYFSDDKIETFQQRGEFVQVRGGLLPLIRLSETFGVEKGKRGGIGVIIKNSEGVEYCLMVEEIMDHQQVVIKRIGGLEKLPGILGGALLGDGTIGLVLNIDFFSSLCS